MLVGAMATQRAAAGDLRRRALGRRADAPAAAPPRPLRRRRPGDARLHAARRRAGGRRAPHAAALEEIRREPIAATLDLARARRGRDGGARRRVRAGARGRRRREPACASGPPATRSTSRRRCTACATSAALRAESGRARAPDGAERHRRADPAPADPAGRARRATVLDAAAVAGREFGVELLAAVVSRGACPRSATRCRRRSATASSIEVPGHVDRFAFRHALVRRRSTRDQPPSRRIGAARALRRGARGERRARRRAGAPLLRRPPSRPRRAGAAPLARRGAVGVRRARLRGGGRAPATARSRSSPPRGPSATPSAATCCSRAAGRCGAPARRRRRSGRSSARPSSRGGSDDPVRFASAALGFGRRYYDPGKTQGPARGAARGGARAARARRTAGRGRGCSAGLADALHFREPPERVQAYSREAVAMARRLGDDDALVVALLEPAQRAAAHRAPGGAPADRRRGARARRPGAGRASTAPPRCTGACTTCSRPATWPTARREHAAPERARRAAAASRCTGTSPRPGRRSGSRPPGASSEAEAWRGARSTSPAARTCPTPRATTPASCSGCAATRAGSTRCAAEVRDSIGDPPTAARLARRHGPRAPRRGRQRARPGGASTRSRPTASRRCRPTSSGSARCACSPRRAAGSRTPPRAARPVRRGSRRTPSATRRSRSRCRSASCTASSGCWPR